MRNSTHPKLRRAIQEANKALTKPRVILEKRGDYVGGYIDTIQDYEMAKEDLAYIVIRTAQVYGFIANDRSTKWVRDNKDADFLVMEFDFKGTTVDAQFQYNGRDHVIAIINNNTTLIESESDLESLFETAKSELQQDKE